MCKVVEDFKVVVDYPTPSTESQDPPETSEVQPTIIAVPVPPIRMQVLGGVLNIGTPKFQDVSKNIGQITLYFSLMEMVEVYAMQSAAVVEIKVREGALVKKVKAANKSVKNMKIVVQDFEQKMKTWEENCHSLDKVVALACTNFAEEGITEEMGPKSKIVRLGEIAEDL